MRPEHGKLPDRTPQILTADGDDRVWSGGLSVDAGSVFSASELFAFSIEYACSAAIPQRFEAGAVLHHDRSGSVL
ncbi:hypothetical protein [Nesterenkonia massiliensis]|uniref:hypothetical protein n=1 Tax=Nesterenkonia massiliensis TaxID=1232429 RepID=UPI0003FD6F15|nr:hypothetical protein [Nesterenkonia massiliensis]